MKFFFRYGRRIIYSVALVWAFFLYYKAGLLFPTTSSALSTLMRQYALTALFLLYIVLTPGLILSFFPRFWLNSIFIHIRRAFGVSVFFFALLHATIGFFHNLSGNVASVLFLSIRNQWALLFSTTAFCILSLMAISSFDVMERLLGKRWKKLHKFVYVAAILILFHAFFIGSHFTVPTNPIPVLINIVSLLFIFLEVAATWKRLKKKTVSAAILLIAVLIGGSIASYKGFTARYDPHAAHRKGYSENYTLKVTRNASELTFQITDKRTGKLLTRYQPFMEKLMHVVVLRKDLLSYDHIHPQYDGKDTFTISHTFPTDGTYYLFVEYSPPDFYENLSVAQITVGQTQNEKAAFLSVGEFTKIFADKYQVTLSGPDIIKVNDTIDFTFTLKDEGVPITNLETYLGAFGHMSAVSEDLQTYTHVHPITMPLMSTDIGGPTVQFSTFFPKPGKYKLFTQFKHEGKVFVTNFVVEVK